VGESGSGKSQTMMARWGFSPPTGARRGSALYRGPGICSACPSGAEQGARQEDHHDLPGADDLARSALQDRPPADRADHASWRKAGLAEARARAIEMLKLVGIPEPKRRMGLLSARAVGRAAPARDDRHGAGQRSGPADRGRADDGARRDDPGGNPRTHGGAAEAARHGDRLHHPRPQHRAAHRRPRLCDAAGRGGGAWRGEDPLRKPAARLHKDAASAEPSGHQGAGAARRAEDAWRDATWR
jgi:hypothetical protein